jgi:hypothetical protein
MFFGGDGIIFSHLDNGNIGHLQFVTTGRSGVCMDGAVDHQRGLLRQGIGEGKGSRAYLVLHHYSLDGASSISDEEKADLAA